MMNEMDENFTLFSENSENLSCDTTYIPSFTENINGMFKVC